MSATGTWCKEVVMKAKVVFEELAVPADTVHAFARQMDKLPQWASGLASGIEQRAGRWFTQSPMGEVEVVMAPDNPFGVLDHDVILPDGSRVHNAFRVTPAGEGSVLTFVVLQTPGMTDAQHAADAAHVQRDLRALRGVLEAVARH
jgi:hypothetical protein